MIYFQQPGTEFERHGPFSSALNDWIDAERTQESFRQKSSKCMEQLDVAAKVVSKVSLSDLQNTQFFDLELVIAFLQWLFTEEYNHDEVIQRDYPTRSFHVWSLAFLLNKLGFLIEASTTPIQNTEMWKDQASQTYNMNPLWQVHLVTSNSVFADHAYSHRPSRRADFRERRVVPIGTIPIVAFDNFKYYDSPDLDLRILNEIFLEAFGEVTEKLPNYPYLRDLAGSRVESSNLESSKHVVQESQLTAYQQQKLDDWVEHPGVTQLLQRSISTHIPEQCPDSCGKAKCYYPVPFEESNGGSEEAIRWRQELRKDHKLMSPWIQMHVIMLAFAYAVACQLIITEGNNRANLETQVSWRPIKFFDNQEDWTKIRIVTPDGDLKTWVRTMSAVLNYHLEPLEQIPTEKWPQHRRLKKTLFHMVCGHRSEFLDSEIRETIQEQTLGCSANGLTMISKALIDPAVDASTLHLYYIRFGRILELPVSSMNLIEGCSPVKVPAHKSKYDPSKSRISYIVLQSEDHLAKDVRWDAEPDWFADFTKVALCCRINGLPCGVFSPWFLARKCCVSGTDPERCPCTCSSSQIGQKITFPEQEYWIEYSLRDFYYAGTVFNPHFRLSDEMTVGETRNIFVQAGKRAHNQLAALDMIASRASNKADSVVRKILSPCLICAAECARSRPSHWTNLFRGEIRSKKIINFIILST